MTSKELVKRVINGWGFPIIEETDHVIVTRYQMNYVQIGSLQEDTNGIAVMLCSVFKADNEREMILALKTCNELNFRMMQVKFYIDHDNDLVISSEFFYNNEDEVEDQLNTAMNAVISGKKRYISQYKDTEADDKILRELYEQS